jgi:plasmid maintenance system antidote protein VapI
MPPIHPGETLREDFMKPLDSRHRHGQFGCQPIGGQYDIVRGRRAITADTALRLAGCFGTTPRFWMDLQSNYDLELAQAVRVP